MDTTPDQRAVATRQLLSDWIDAQTKLIGEFSGAITSDYRTLIADARRRVELVGVTWTDDLVPSHVTDALRWDTDD